MDQIKLFRQGSLKLGETSPQFEFEEARIPQRKKLGRREQAQTIEPWMQEADANPFLLFRSEQIKKSQSPPLKRQVSLALTNNWKSMEKNMKIRQSKRLPVMDIGELNSIRKGIFPTKIKSKLDFNSSPTKGEERISISAENALPSVQRQLSIQRKLFLMKTFKSDMASASSSPSKSSRLRNIIKDSRV